MSPEGDEEPPPPEPPPPESSTPPAVPPVTDPAVLAEVTARRDDVTWRGWDALAIGLIYLLAALPLYLVMPGGMDPEADPVPLLDSGVLLLVTLGWLRWVRGRLAVRRAFGSLVERPRLRTGLLLALLLGVAAPLVDTGLYALLELVGGPVPPMQEHLEQWVSRSGVPALVALDIVLLTPVAEELIFRGVLFQGLARRWGFWWGAVVSSLLFGLAHMESTGLDSLFLVVSTALFGLGCAWLLQRRRSLLVPIAAHVVVNTIGTVALFAA